MVISIEERQKILEEFVQAWPVSRLESMTLTDYICVGDKNTLAYWLEFGEGRYLGSIKGGDASKFGIYERKALAKGQRDFISSDDRFSWKNKYGTSAQKAFENIKGKILEVVRFAALGNVEAIDELDFETALKWKLAYLYQNHEKPCVISIYKLDKLKWLFPNDDKLTHPFVYRELMKSKGDTNLIQYSAQLWRKAGEIEGNKTLEEDEGDFNMSENSVTEPVAQPLNQILFGPPGTGKTYSTIDEALRILDAEFFEKNYSDRTALKACFDEFVGNQDIRFVTFHQSLSYEDFVEGLVAETEDGKISYEVRPGIFKQMCDAALAKVIKKQDTNINLAGKHIWKMSLGNTQADDGYIFQECIDQNRILLGYGDDLDFSHCKDRTDVYNHFVASGRTELSRNSYEVTAVSTFMSRMSIGDLVVVSEGNYKFRAIGEITSGYQFIDRNGQDSYSQARSVRWLRVYQPGSPSEKLMNNAFSQMTLYELRDTSINHDKLLALFSDSQEEQDKPRSKVLIIDEINRGNIAKIFGELITLIEPSKRSGSPEALEVILPYSKKAFSVPNNLYIIGTMNTSDRSLSGLDIALRRRFVFKEMPPKPELLKDVTVEGINLEKLLVVINQRIEVLLGRDYCLGHTYFMSLNSQSSIYELGAIFQKQIFPLLQEYFFEDWQRIQWVLNDHRKTSNQFVTRKTTGELNNLFGSEVTISEHQLPWVINDKAFTIADAYLGIL